MRNVRVFKALDKKNSFLGLKGLYFKLMCIGAGILAAIAIVSIPFITELGAFCLFAVTMILLWAFIVKTQASHSERELRRLMSARNLPDVIRVEPKSLYSQSKYHYGENPRTLDE